MVFLGIFPQERMLTPKVVGNFGGIVGAAQDLLAVVAGVKPSARVFDKSLQFRASAVGLRKINRIGSDGEIGNAIAMTDEMFEHGCFIALCHAGRANPAALEVGCVYRQ